MGMEKNTRRLISSHYFGASPSTTAFERLATSMQLCSVMCLQCNKICENAPDENIGDLANDEVNLELLGEQMDREDVLKQPDDDHPGERSDKENTENLKANKSDSSSESEAFDLPGPSTAVKRCRNN